MNSTSETAPKNDRVDPIDHDPTHEYAATERGSSQVSKAPMLANPWTATPKLTVTPTRLTIRFAHPSGTREEHR